MSFCTAINCIDGRTQIPVIEYLKRRFNVDYVDVVTEPGGVAGLSSDVDSDVSQSVFRRVEVSMKAHNSRSIAIVAHYDCAGNRVDESEQHRQLKSCVCLLARKYAACDIVGLWVNDEWSVSEV